MKIVIGLVGEKGSGKETFVKFLKEIFPHKKIVHTRFSDILKETLDLWNLPATRENLQNMAIVMNKGFGESTLSDAVYNRVKNEISDIIILDGIRWMSDVDLVRRFDKSYIVYITADLKIRYERIKNRNEKRGESRTSFKKFVKEEGVYTEQFISKIGKKADFVIENKGSLKDFAEKVREFCGNKLAGKTKF